MKSIANESTVRRRRRGEGVPVQDRLCCGTGSLLKKQNERIKQIDSILEEGFFVNPFILFLLNPSTLRH